MPSRVVFSFGSNLGNRRCYLETALLKLESALSCAPCELSPVIETEAFGFDAPPFLNMAAAFRTQVAPLELLHICKDIEVELGRREKLEFAPDGRRIFHSRTIDIDILYYGELEIDTEELKIPHPQVFERPYVRTMLDSLQKGRQFGQND